MHILHFRSSPETAHPDRIETNETLYFIMEGKWNDQHRLQLLFGQQDFIDVRFGGETGNISQHDIVSGFDGVNNPRDYIVCQLIPIIFRGLYPRTHHFTCEIGRQPVFFKDGNVAPISTEIVQ